MTSRLFTIALAATFVIAAASSAAAQAGAPAPANANGGRPLWKNVLIGLGAGVGSGVIIGKMLEYGQEAKCDGGAPDVECTTPYNAKNLSIAGAAIGVSTALIVHKWHRGPAPSRESVVFLSANTRRKGLYVRTAF